MPRTSWLRASLLAVVAGIVLVTPVWAATPDAWITTKAKIALLTTEGVSGTAIKVDTVTGRVTLHGKVYSAVEKKHAEIIAQQINGVTGVDNLLQVVAPQQAQAVQVSDDALRHRSKKALRSDSSLKGSHITVKSVNKGVVLLGGTAETLSAHLHAIEIVASMSGVHRVATEIQSPETLADAEIGRGATPLTSSEERGMWETASDK